MVQQSIIFLLILCLIWSLIKLKLMADSAEAILKGLDDRLETDTNTLISIPSRQSSMLRLAEGINERLADVRNMKRKYQTGDIELKEAVTNISHDLRTPLTSIMGYIELMKKEPLSPDAERYLGIIESRAAAMEDMSDELFKYTFISSSAYAPKEEEVSLNGALEECLSSCYALLTARGIKPNVTMPEKAVIRRLDGSCLARVLENIISNAAKYSQGDIDISIGPDGVMTFSNSAPSLDAAQVGRLFDRYYTVPSARPSTGLGLSIAKTLTERMGGTAKAALKDGRLIITLSF